MEGLGKVTRSERHPNLDSAHPLMVITLIRDQFAIRVQPVI
jgi:hypothetical protein